ncbi:MAG: MATE family efflux transporter [Clostridia bacterium]|nr:MATE family efflux transporter [Clostridia bacterium]
MARDMTRGDPLPILLKFSLPMLLSMAFQQLYSIADSVVIGQLLGDAAFAAVSVSYPVTVLFVAFASGASIGCSVVTAQLFGEKRDGAVKTSASTALLSMTAIGAMLIGIGLLGCRPLLGWMNTQAAIFEDAALYLQIYIGGVLFLFLYNTVNGIFTAIGDSLTPLWLLIASSVLNVGLDLLFVPMWKVAGAAWATFLAQGIVSLIALLLLLLRLRRLPGERTQWFDGAIFVRILKIAVPSVCQQSFVSVGQLFVQGSINSFSSIAVQSGYGGAFKINMFTITCICTLGNSLSSYTAQNTGAKEWERIRRGRRTALWMAVLFAAVVSALVMVFSGSLMSLFTNDDATRAVGQQFLWTVAPFYPFITIKIINDGVFRGTGSMGIFMTCTFLDLGLRVIAAYALPPFIGASGVWWAFPIGWVACTVLSGVWYYTGRWKHGREVLGRS